MFEDRLDAGRKLALGLQHYHGKDVVVLAIARGGVPVGHQIARQLHAEFDVVVARKLPFPRPDEQRISTAGGRR